MRKSKKKKAEELAAQAAVPADQAQISKDDLEAKFREIKVDVDQVKTDKKNQVVPAVSLVAILIMLIAYLFGKRSGKKKSSVVQIRRI